MKKLFCLEDNKNLDESILLIDKVLNYKKSEPTAISVTADIIKERTELKKEINEQLNKEPEEKEDDSSDDSEGSNDLENSDNDNNSDDSSNNNDDSKKKDENKNDSNTADDKDNLKGLIGSDLNNNSSDNKEVAEEKFKLSLKNIFYPIKNKYNKYLVSLEEFNVPDKVKENEQPVVYVKDSVLESLNNLIQVANVYIGKNKTFIDDNTQSIKNINERLTVLKQFIENRKYHFTNKLINDQDLLSNLSITNKSDIRETSKNLVTYITQSSKFVNFILTNEFEKISSSLGNSDFISEEGDFVYKTMLPGFNMIRAHIDNYTNYLNTNIENFHYYKVKTFKAEDLYNLDAISISEDKNLDGIMVNLDKLLIDISMTIDNFNVVNTNLNKLIDEVKVIIFDVEKDKYPSLATIDIDSKVKDFIKFKLVSEVYYININMLIDFILNSISVVNGCIELKQ